ncbi:hypothetical protein GCM10010247_30430 [Streptomyces calvus]|nr:hypothetical protein GCM10010247_30430 [Streptomyces calvus]
MPRGIGPVGCGAGPVERGGGRGGAEGGRGSHGDRRCEDRASGHPATLRDEFVHEYTPGEFGLRIREIESFQFVSNAGTLNRAVQAGQGVEQQAFPDASSGMRGAADEG